jgi:hypothetical protein
MASKWIKNPPPPGNKIFTSVRGSKLSDGDTHLASVSYSDGRYSSPEGWYWVTPTNSKLNITLMNTCYSPVASEADAKEQAKSYVDACLKHAQIQLF